MTAQHAETDKGLAGRALRRRAQGSKSDALGELLDSLDAGVGEWSDSFVFGTVWARDGLDFESRMIVAITALATQGKSALLRNYAHGALQAGISAQKIQEALTMLVVYAGFPTATSMLYEWHSVLASARRSGIEILDDPAQ